MKAVQALSLTLALALGSSASIVPKNEIQARATVSTDASCQKMFDTCEAAVAGAAGQGNAWSHKSCVLAASCFPTMVPVDDMLSAAYHNSPAAGTSLNQTDVVNTVFGDASSLRVTQQNWIDAWYSELSRVGGPFPPNPNLIIGYFNRIQTWSGRCTQAMPWFNFADYFKHSSTWQGAGGPGCTTISSDASCQKLFETCKDKGIGNFHEVSQLLTAWSFKSCVLAAACYPGSANVARFLYAASNGGTDAPTPVNSTRVTSSIFGNPSSTSVSQQNWIDAWYGELSRLGGPFPTSADVVISYYKRIQSWTGRCGQVVPWVNFADYYQFSSSSNPEAGGC